MRNPETTGSRAGSRMVKARTPDKEHLLANLQQRSYHIEQVGTARLNAKDDPAAMVRSYHALLEQPEAYLECLRGFLRRCDAAATV